MNNILSHSTNNLRRVLTSAAHLAARMGKERIEPAHLFYGLLNKNNLTVPASPEKQSVHQKKTKVHSPATTATLSLSPTSRRILLDAAALAHAYNHPYVGTEHLFISLLESKNPGVQKIIANNRLNSRDIKENLSLILESSSRIFDLLDTIITQDAPPAHDHCHGHESEETEKPAQKNKRISALEFFSTVLTNPEVIAKTDPVIGRENELERLMWILARRTKNNPVLLGPPGVGKTAIVEGLARKITAGEVPDALKNKKIYSLNLTTLVAGSAFRGEFEMRLKQVLDEAQADPQVILFIDEIHNVAGAGSSNGSFDAGNILKPALARGEVRCIGATTPQEYKKYIEEDAALERRFQPVQVAQPSMSDAEKILTGLAGAYATHHNVEITPAAISAAVRLSDRFIPEKFLPDKAIDLLDEACARARLSVGKDPREQQSQELEKRIQTTARQKEYALYQNNDLEFAKKLHEEEQQLKKNLADLKEALAQTILARPVITENHIAIVVASISGIPVANMVDDERKALLNLEERLSARVVAQDHVKQDVAHYIRRARAGLTSPTRPLASFLFLGGSGVGKTELARTIAAEIFGAEGLIKLDMSEFSESFTISRLTGAPSGYIGYKEGGKLTESVRAHPHSLILFDEIEKAHPKIHQLLLQILEDGTLTDSAGKKVDFRNTIIVLTSNIGTKKFSSGKELGFGEYEGASAVRRKGVTKELKELFSPELLNRIDRVSVFDPLTAENIATLVERALNDLKNRLLGQNIEFSWSSAALARLVTLSFHEEHGARHVRHVLEQEVESTVANLLLAASHTGRAITLDLQSDALVIKNF